MTKCVRGGKVAVLYSSSYGAGWSTWNNGYEKFLLHDEGLVQLVENGEFDKIDAYVKSTFPDADIYTGGADDLKIAWLNEGTLFRISEYDGAESIEISDRINWNVA